VTAHTPCRPPRPATPAATAPRQRDDRADHAAGDDPGDEDLDAWIAELAARAPPLTAAQRDKLALLLASRPQSHAA
jgi:hypothetical protein